MAQQDPRQTEKCRHLRRQLTFREQRLWSALRSRRAANLKMRRQYPIRPYVADFVCLAHRLIIELDGDSHLGRADYDRHRQAHLESAAFRVLRVGNDDVLKDVNEVVMAVLRACGIAEE